MYTRVYLTRYRKGRVKTYRVSPSRQPLVPNTIKHPFTDRPRRHLKYRSTIIKSCSIRCNAKLPKSPSPIEYTPGQGSIFSAVERSVNKQNLFSTSACSRPPPWYRQPPSLSLSLFVEEKSSRDIEKSGDVEPGGASHSKRLSTLFSPLFFFPISFPAAKKSKVAKPVQLYTRATPYVSPFEFQPDRGLANCWANLGWDSPTWIRSLALLETRVQVTSSFVCAKDSSGLQETLFIEKEVCLRRVEVAGR